jgi:hypothetical protein
MTGKINANTTRKENGKRVPTPKTVRNSALPRHYKSVLLLHFPMDPEGFQEDPRKIRGNLPGPGKKQDPNPQSGNQDRPGRGKDFQVARFPWRRKNE